MKNSKKTEKCPPHFWEGWGEREYEAFVGWVQYRDCFSCGFCEQRVIMQYENH